MFLSLRSSCCFHETLCYVSEGQATLSTIVAPAPAGALAPVGDFPPAELMDTGEPDTGSSATANESQSESVDATGMLIISPCCLIPPSATWIAFNMLYKLGICLGKNEYHIIMLDVTDLYRMIVLTLLIRFLYLI